METDKMPEYVVGFYTPMICASSEAEKRTYYRVNGKRGEIYLIVLQDNSADDIYVGAKLYNDQESDFGGKILRFQLEDGSFIELQGPWHTNADDLFVHTGVDLRDKYLTFGVIARNRKLGPNYSIILVDLLHQDADWVIGKFDRIKDMAQVMADNLGQTLQYYSQSQCRSSLGTILPLVAKGV